ncbi:hypothetical protein RI054_17g80920 [Pseudoscourfieldia marina]
MVAHPNVCAFHEHVLVHLVLEELLGKIHHRHRCLLALKQLVNFSLARSSTRRLATILLFRSWFFSGVRDPKCVQPRSLLLEGVDGARQQRRVRGDLGVRDAHSVQPRSLLKRAWHRTLRTARNASVFL